MGNLKDYKALLEQYKITVPEGTSDEVIKLLVDKHEEAIAATTAKDKAIEEGAKELANLEEKLQAEQALPKSGEYGVFSVDKKKYKLTTGKMIIKRADADQAEEITAADFLKDKDLQALSIKEKWGIVEPIN